MFEYYEKGKTLVPIHIWLDSFEELEPTGCLEQAVNLASLPFAFHHIALMPDTHRGVGMPIGGIIACKDTIIPNAVGVDIGCGMAFVQTNVPATVLRDTITGSGPLLKCIIGDFLRSIPVGRMTFKKPQQSYVLENAECVSSPHIHDEALLKAVEKSRLEVGTLGGGNHFIEIQEDENGFACLMLHTGSRVLGNMICNHFDDIASEFDVKYFPEIPQELNLPFLPVSSEEGQRYLKWMQLAMDYAYENRAVILENIKKIFADKVAKYTDISIEFSNEINCHHNYASLERHYGEDVWVHRKGAINAADGKLGIIPGAMGSYSYIVKGKGCEDSFLSSSHGAGRLYSRTGAMEAFTVQTVMDDLRINNVVLGKRSKTDVAEECRFAYKDIDTVMNNQSDLTFPIKRMKTMGVIKG